MQINFEDIQVYDFSNLNLQEEGNDNCYSCGRNEIADVLTMCDSDHQGCDW